MSKPVLLLVPGAWFLPTVYDSLVQSLKALKYECIVGAYPSTNPRNDPAEVDCATDTHYIRAKYLVPLVETGRDVVIFAHSYGGQPAAGAATGLTKRARVLQGQPGGVIGLIMASAFVLPEGISCAGAMGGDTPAWVLKDQPSANLCLPDNPYEMFEHDVDEITAKESLKVIVPHATGAFFSPQPKPVFYEESFKGLFAYFKLMEDRAVPPAAQDAMMQGTGLQWITRELYLSHNSGFVTEVEEMTDSIDDLVHQFLDGQ